MPDLRRDPARRLRRKAKPCPLHFAAGEDAVAAAEVRIELVGRDLFGAALAKLGGANGIHREAPQALAHVAPRVHVPVAAVVHEALRRDLALGLAVLLAVVVANPQPKPPQHAGRDQAEELLLLRESL